jgi:hypothetical protein
VVSMFIPAELLAITDYLSRIDRLKTYKAGTVTFSGKINPL